MSDDSASTETKRNRKHLNLTKKVQDDICAIIRRGNCRDTACASTGVLMNTFRLWVRMGTPGDKNYVGGKWETFANEVAAAEAEVEQALVGQIRAGVLNSGMPDWKASAWLLENRFPKRWNPKYTGPETDGARPSIEVVTKDGHKVELDIGPIPGVDTPLEDDGKAATDVA